MSEIRSILQDAKTIAVVGCSDSPSRTSHRIAQYLQKSGYRVVPVNPHHDKILGETCYADLSELPDDISIDIVNIFRRPQFTAEMVHDAVAYSKKRKSHPAIWTQLGVSSSEARTLAEEAQLPYIQNRCIMVEHGRLVG